MMSKLARLWVITMGGALLSATPALATPRVLQPNPAALALMQPAPAFAAAVAPRVATSGAPAVEFLACSNSIHLGVESDQILVVCVVKGGGLATHQARFAIPANDARANIVAQSIVDVVLAAADGKGDLALAVTTDAPTQGYRRLVGAHLQVIN